MANSEAQERLKGTYHRNRLMKLMRDRGGISYAKLGVRFPSKSGKPISRQAVHKILDRQKDKKSWSLIGGK